jgi:plastocyanin
MTVKGARALASGMLVLAAICAAPAVSAAQDAGTTTTTTTTTPADPAQPVDTGSSTTTTPAPRGPGAGTPGEAPDQTRTATTTLADSPPATGPLGGGARKAASASVTMGDFFFSPASVTVSVGDTVTWRNTGQAPHNATGNGGSFSTATIDNGESASHTFNSAGTFSYICTIHPQMKGTVRVLSANSGGGGGSGGSAGSSGSGTSESSAVASPSAAGDSNTLPMTGMAAGALALVGATLLASGLLVRRAGDRERRRLSIF